MKKLLKYTDFKLLENMNLAKSIVSKKMNDFEKLKEILKDNLGYIGKFTEFLFKEDITIEDLETTYKRLLELKRNGRPLNIQDMDYEKLVDKIQEENEDISIRRFINEFPSEQKKLLKQGFKQEKEKLKTTILKIIKKDITPFISKISRYKTYDNLKQAMQIFAKDPINDREKVKEIAKQSKFAEIIYEKDNIMILYIASFSEIEKFASDTSWCILSKSMWDRYTSGGKKQFIIYDFTKPEFDPDMKIGVTLTPSGGIHAAHNILDKGATQKVKSLEIEYGFDMIKIFNDMKQRLKEMQPEIKLKHSTSMKKWLEVIPDLTKEEIKRWFNIVLNWSKPQNFHYQVLNKMVGQYFSDKRYVFKKDIEELHPDAITFTTNIKGKYIDIGTSARITISFWVINAVISAIKDGALSDDMIANNIDHFKIAQNLVKVQDFYYTGKLNVTIDPLTKIMSDKLNSIYNDNSITYKDQLTKRGGKDSILMILTEKGIRLSRSFETAMVLLNMALKNNMDQIGGNVAKNHKTIYDDERNKRILVKFYPVSNVEIDLHKDYLGEPSREKIKHVKKQDYLGFKHALTKTNPSALIDHLKDNKLEFIVYRETAKKLISDIPYLSNETLKMVLTELKKNKRFLGGEMATFNNLTLKVKK